MSGASDPEFEERDLQAAEYVMGLLPPLQARAMEALALSDPAVAGAIAVWEDLLTPLADIVPPVQPPPMLWRRLALATGIEAREPPVQSATPARIWRSPNLWRATTAGALAIAASLAFLLYNKPAKLPEPLLAALTPANSPGATFLVRVNPDGTATVAAVSSPAVPQGRSLQLWALRANTTVPVSLGLLPDSGRTRLQVREPQGTQLLVSQEPLGGSPTQLPTGPVVYSGLLTGI